MFLSYDGDAFARRITNPFLEARNEKWMVSFYAFLNGHRGPLETSRSVSQP